MLVGFANSFVWQFAGPDTNSSMSILNFNLVQPLLRAGSRAVVLEQLTIAERTLLYNLRAMMRYRQGVFTNIAVGDFSGVTGPQRVGGFTGGTGLTGFSGQGSGGLGGVGQATAFGRAGFTAADERHRRGGHRAPASPAAARRHWAASWACCNSCNKSATPRTASTCSSAPWPCSKPISKPA